METYNNTNNTTAIEANGLMAGGRNSCNCGSREGRGNCECRECRGNREGRQNRGERRENCECREDREDDFEQQIGLQFLPLLANISNAYFLNKLGRYFRGQGCEVRIEDDEKAYYILKNSHKSKHNIFVNSYDFANLSGSAIKVTLYSCGELSPCADYSEEKGVTGNSKCCRKQNDTQGKILTINGTRENQIECGTPGTTFTVAPYETVHGTLRGSIALGKGDILIAELSGFCPRNTAYAMGSFEWWTEPIDKCSPFNLSCPR